MKELAGDFNCDEMVKLVANALKAHVGTAPDEAVLRSALDAQNFVDVRTILGGTAQRALDPQIARAAAQTDTDSAAVGQERERIPEAAFHLRGEVERWKAATDAAVAG